ncbi:MAG: hypothetical protein UX46_C0013G0006 [Candidatus Amesbacteria bacterium GW2011_GWC1_46_24]|nr:MAG: hypothetical protein UX46_C0013G0006 [Candidatus Amesbacteria bacterium GW2011_GWC1_46_24]
MDEVNNKGKRNIWLVILLLILILFLVVAVYLVQKQTFYKSRAYSYTETVVSPVNNVEIANSYAFASPLKAKSGGEYIRVTVYVLDAQGMGIKGKSVEIGEAEGLEINEVQATSDDTGMVLFDIASTKEGLFIIQPVVDGRILSQRINITFE